MTTIKTLVLASMMIVGTATGFANNNNHVRNTRHNTPAPVAAVQHAMNHRHDCRCRQCDDFRIEQERLHRFNRGPIEGCSCPKCESMRHHAAPAPQHHTAPAMPQNGGGRR